MNVVAGSRYYCLNETLLDVADGPYADGEALLLLRLLHVEPSLLEED